MSVEIPHKNSKKKPQLIDLGHKIMASTQLSDDGWYQNTLRKTKRSPWKLTGFPGKYHQNAGFSIAMVVYWSHNSFLIGF